MVRVSLVFITLKGSAQNGLVSVLERLEPSLARASDLSLPIVPLCPGTYTNTCGTLF